MLYWPFSKTCRMLCKAWFTTLLSISDCNKQMTCCMKKTGTVAEVGSWDIDAFRNSRTHVWGAYGRCSIHTQVRPEYEMLVKERRECRGTPLKRREGRINQTGKHTRWPPRRKEKSQHSWSSMTEAASDKASTWLESFRSGATLRLFLHGASPTAGVFHFGKLRALSSTHRTAALWTGMGAMVH